MRLRKSRPTDYVSAPSVAAPAQRQSADHEQIRSLQRSVGNRQVAQLLRLPQARGGLLQRWIHKGKSGEYTIEQALEAFKRAHGDVYGIAQEQVGDTGDVRMDDDAIREFLRPYVENNDKDYYTYTVFKDLCDEIASRKVNENVVPRGGVDGAEVRISSTSVDLPKQVLVKQEGGDIDMHPSGVINFVADGSYTRPKVGGPWRVGMVQTLLRARRTVRLLHEGGVYTITIDVPAPHNDRRAAPPWYDRLWTREFDKESGMFHISLDDRPGMRFPSIPGTRLLDSAGADIFKTWLMLRNESNSKDAFLHEWSWQVAYDPGGQAALTGETDTTDGAGAVLDGARATEDYQDIRANNPTWNIPSMQTYQQMKDNAKKKFTPASGMMPVATYGNLRTTAVDQLRQGDVNGAIGTLQQMQANLHTMRDKQSYWKNTQAKTQYFNPILSDVTHAINTMGTL